MFMRNFFRIFYEVRQIVGIIMKTLFDDAF